MGESGIRYIDENGDERYEIFVFDATEDDHIIADILIDLPTLIHNSENSSEPEIITSSINPTNSSITVWHTKRRRSSLNPPPIPPRVHHVPPPPPPRLVTKNNDNGEGCSTYSPSSPSSPLSYKPIEAKTHHNNDQHYIVQSKKQLKNKSKKGKLKEWEEYIEELEQTKQQLVLSLDQVRKYQETLLELNAKLKAKRDEVNSELKKENPSPEVNGGFDLNIKTGSHQFTPAYYPGVPVYVAKNERILQAAEARHRRKMKIIAKKKSK